MIQFALVALMMGAPCEQAYAVEAKDSAPCEGLLVPVLEAKRCMRAKAIDLPMCVTDLDHCIEAKRAEGSAYTKTISALDSQSRELERMLSDALEPEPWWHNPYVGFTVGVVATGLVAVTLALRE